MKKSYRRKSFLIVLQVIITFVFLYLTFKNTHITHLKSVFLSVNYGVLCLTLVPQFLSLFLLAFREKYLLNKIHAFHFRDLFEATLIGMVGNNVLPLRGGEFLKVLYWSKQSNKSYVSLLSVALIERMLDLIFLIMLFFVGSQAVLLQLGFNIRWIVTLMIAIFSVIAVFILLDRKYQNEFKLHATLQKLLGDAVSHYCNDFINKVMAGFRVLGSVKNVTIAFLITVLYWGMSIAGLWIAFYAFHLPISWERITVLMLATCLGTAIPAAPGYIGTFDYFSKMALMLYGVKESVAISFALATHFMSIVPLTLIGMIFVYPAMGRLLKSKQASA